MNKNIIKIGIPIIGLAAIIIFVAATQKPINKLSSELRIEPFDFKSYVGQYIADSIEGQTIDASKIGYDKLYQIISTEASITSSTAGGQYPLLSSQDAEECFENAFKAYYSMFGADANRLFSNSSWGEGELTRIKAESQRLLSLRGCDSAKDSLNHYINYVNGYYSAIKLLNQSRYCNSASGYEQYVSSARPYNTFPYSNNSRLRNIASNVSSNARDGWRNSITQYVENICINSNDKYGSYNDFYSGDFQKAYEKISEYNSKFNTNWGADLKSKLNNKDTQVKSFFNSNR